MLKYVLVVIISAANGRTATTVEFPQPDACMLVAESVATEIQEIPNSSTDGVVLCYDKTNGQMLFNKKIGDSE